MHKFIHVHNIFAIPAKVSLLFFAMILCTSTYAGEVSTISDAKGQQPSCSGNEYNPPNTYATLQASACQQCGSDIQSEIENANSKLASAKSQDQALNAKTQAGTAADAAKTTGVQHNTEFNTASVNNQGMQAVQQQAQLATKVASDMNACAQNIRSKCSGKVSGSDQSMVDQSAQSCEQSAQQAQQTASEKNAKAAEMAKNGQQANQSGQGMQPPQMPQGGQGMAASPTGNGGLDSGLSGTNLNSKIAGLQEPSQGPKIQSTSGKTQESTGRNFHNTPITGSAVAAKSTTGSKWGNENGSGASKMGVSASNAGSGGSLGSGQALASIRDKDGNVMPAAAMSSEGDYNGAGGGSRSTASKSTILGLGTSGEDLQALASNTGADDPLKNSLKEENDKMLAANAHHQMEDESIFKRVSSKIRAVSIARTMQ